MTLKTTYITSLRALFCSVAVLGFSACSTNGAEHGSVYEDNKFQISEQIERLELYPQVNGLQLNPRDTEAVNRFLSDFVKNGDGQIFMNVPSNQVNGLGARQAQTLIRTALSQSGFATTNIQTGQYQVPPRAPAPVVVSYRKFATLIPRCNVMEDLRFTGNNRAFKGFGCAHFANQAALVGDHRQLLEPAPQTAPDSLRRSAVYQAYTQGVDPSSENGFRQAITFGGN